MSNSTNLKMWVVISVFLLALGIGTSSVFATGTYDGGNGSQGNPFEINTPAQMNDIGHHSEDWGSYFILTADIDLAGYTGTAFNIIGSTGTPFTGSFDGNGHTISNFTYTTTDTDYIGLFGYVGIGGEIKNLGMTNVNVDAGTGRYVGGLVGENSQGTVSNCHAAGNVTGTGSYVGGMVGYNGFSGGTVSNCYATGSVAGYTAVGGLVGKNVYGTVSNCRSTGSVSGDDGVGGLVGYNYKGTVSNCQATGSVTGGYSVGGLVGINQGTVSNCYAAGNVTGTYLYSKVGGLVGYNYQGSVSNCYATGSVSGTLGDVGGLVGYNYDADIFASFWDMQTTGQSSAVGFIEGACTIEVYGRTTAEMQTESTFTDAGWDFVLESDNGTENVWTIHEHVDYPKHVWKLVNFVDWDGVDFKDYSYFANHWMLTDCSNINNCNGTDLDFSDTVDIKDLKIFLDHWLAGVE